MGANGSEFAPSSCGIQSMQLSLASWNTCTTKCASGNTQAVKYAQGPIVKCLKAQNSIMRLLVGITLAAWQDIRTMCTDVSGMPSLIDHILTCIVASTQAVYSVE